jgi:hypothetical protein
VTSSNRSTCCKAGADLITRRNADTCGDIYRAGWSIDNNQGTDPDPTYDTVSLCPYCGTRLPVQTLAPVHEDKRLIVIDLGGGVVHGVQTNIPELEGVKVVVLADRGDSDPDRDEVVIEGTNWIVYQTERVAISDCTWLLKSLTQYEFQKVEDPA